MLWREFVAAFNEGFWPSKYDDHAGALAKLRSGVHREYEAEFEKVAKRCHTNPCLRPSL